MVLESNVLKDLSSQCEGYEVVEGYDLVCIEAGVQAKGFVEGDTKAQVPDSVYCKPYSRRWGSDVLR